MRALQLTSLLLGTIACHACYIGIPLYFYTYTLLTVSSSWFHATPIPPFHYSLALAVRRFDKLLAHAAFILTLTDTPKALRANAGWLLLFPFTVLCLWFSQSLFPARRDGLHLCLHLVGIIGVHVYLRTLY